MSYESMIEKLKAVKQTTKSTSSKLLLMSCINELSEMMKSEKQQPVAKQEFYVMQRLKLNPVAVKQLLGMDLSPEGLKQRFIVNTIDKENNQVWVIDATGNERPQWLLIDLLMPEND